MGIVLLLAGIAVGMVAAAWLLTNEDLESSARILGLGLALIVLVAPMVGAGAYLAFAGGAGSPPDSGRGPPA